MGDAVKMQRQISSSVQLVTLHYCTLLFLSSYKNTTPSMIQTRFQMPILTITCNCAQVQALTEDLRRQAAETEALTSRCVAESGAMLALTTHAAELAALRGEAERQATAAQAKAADFEQQLDTALAQLKAAQAGATDLSEQLDSKMAQLAEAHSTAAAAHTELAAVQAGAAAMLAQLTALTTQLEEAAVAGLAREAALRAQMEQAGEEVSGVFKDLVSAFGHSLS